MPAALFEAEGVFHAVDGACRVDEHDVEPDPCPAPVRMGGEEKFGGGEQAGALARRERFGGGGVGGAALDLDEGEQAGLFGGDVDLAGLGAQAAAQDGPARADQGGAGDLFGGEAGGITGCSWPIHDQSGCCTGFSLTPI